MSQQKRLFRVDVPAKDPPYEYKTRHYIGEDAFRFDHDDEETDGWRKVYEDRPTGSTFVVFRRVRP
jgi:hypothetical protein